MRHTRRASLLATPLLLVAAGVLWAQQSSPTTVSSQAGGGSPSGPALHLQAGNPTPPEVIVQTPGSDAAHAPLPSSLALGPDATLQFTGVAANGDLVGVLRVRVSGQWRTVSLEPPSAAVNKSSLAR